MKVRLVKSIDYPALAKIYHAFFPVHDIFRSHHRKVIQYLKNQAKAHSFLVAEDNHHIVGAVFLVLEGQNASHKRWKFRHFAFKSDTVALELLKEAERKVSSKSKTAKIELTIAQNERGRSFYLKQGYLVEGVLKNHYRWKETCYALGKSLVKR